MLDILRIPLWYKTLRIPMLDGGLTFVCPPSPGLDLDSRFFMDLGDKKRDPGISPGASSQFLPILFKLLAGMEGFPPLNSSLDLSLTQVSQTLPISQS